MQNLKIGENFENLENMSSWNEGIQYAIKLNDLSILRIECANMCLKNSKEKAKNVTAKWYLNLGHNKTAIHIW